MTAHSRVLTRVGCLIRLAAVTGLLPLLAACAPGVALQKQTPAPVPANVAFDDSEKNWWRVYFHLAWDQAEEPDWHVDALLADQVMAPIIAHTEARISLWRFHRRAAPDGAGHRFSFIFFADPETAEVINNGVTRSPVTARLLDAGVVLEVQLAVLDEPLAEDIGGMSDSAWPEAVMRSWPWFIMGVSQSWLKLVDEVKAQRPPPDEASVEEMLEYYRGINDEVSTLWREQGQHAYLHHLNALFGYQLLIIRETNLTRF